MSKKRGLTIEEKRTRMLEIFYGMRRSNNETYQFMTVTHKRYAQLLNKHRDEEEKK